MNGKDLIQLLKSVDGNLPHGLCIPVGRPIVACLRPVASLAGRQNAQDVARLTEWRNRHPLSFLTEFHATAETTSAWLANVVYPRDAKILFMLDTPSGETFGYMGLDCIDWEHKHGEADAIVKGMDVGRGVMKQALLTLLDWAREQLGLETIDVRVLSDNPALAFYHKVGFVEYQRRPLRRVDTPTKVIWEEDDELPSAARHLVYLKHVA